MGFTDLLFMSDQPGKPCSKGTPQRIVKGRKARIASATIRTVRAACVERDGACRIGNWEDNPGDWHADALEGDPCDGRSEWAHLGDHRRCKTRGQTPEHRHSTVGSLMLCQAHHRAYDAHTIQIEPLTDRGADGVLRVTLGGQTGLV